MPDNQKILFFDVDGTLVDFHRQMPESAKTALKRAQANGHKLILCTGRSIYQIYPFLKAFGFDGIVAATGACVTYGGKTVAHHVIGQSRLYRLMQYMDRHDVPRMLQTPTKGVITSRGVKTFGRFEIFHADPPEDTLAVMQKVIGQTEVDDDTAHFFKKYPDAESVVYSGSSVPIKDMALILQGDLKLKATPSSLQADDPGSGEITQLGITKATGMKHLIDYLGMKEEDTIAFGDGPNDIEMLSYAHTSVCLGNGVAEAKAVSDIVTDNIDDDGLAHALEKLGLI